ncbi:septum site-determining protein Ssd [Nocardioides acrostichi]|uniref:Septum site determining protein n=1 Tax=Nocardioides acrostichi TaxID=2784339 RepID=A0A930V4X5_9ACTN|nr:septum site-determining protein Ssd [Nocardioides acrostichi]MBF4163249.1 septum site determining protein [Nocardioides acrostichi]
MSDTRPLLITSDAHLAEEVSRIAAAAGVEPGVVSDPHTVLRLWRTAPLVLVGDDIVESLVRLALPRRQGVHVLSTAAVADSLFRLALAVGAENVSRVAESTDWLVEVLADLGEGRPTWARVIGVIGGAGGAGATTLACALGQVAAGRGRTLVVDTDPLGPGVDRVLGLDDTAGVRWPDLARTTGRLSARSLREAVPRRQRLGVLGWPPGTAECSPFVLREVLSAAARGHETVVVDLPRTHREVVGEVVPRCDVVLVLVPDRVTGLAAATRLCRRLDDPARVRLVLRGPVLDERAAARAAGVPVVGVVRDQRGVEENVDLGFGPLRGDRGALARSARGLLGAVTAPGAVGDDRVA